MPHLTEVQVLRFLIQLTLLFVIARALADVMKRLGQATVIGELLAGIVLGPTRAGASLRRACMRYLSRPTRSPTICWRRSRGSA